MRRPFLIALLLLGLLPGSVFSAEVQIFRNQSQSDFLQGTLEGISLDPLGRLGLADVVERLATVDEPFLLQAANHPEGWVVGTGNSGRVLLVNRSGEVEELFSTPEPQVFAVWADDDGTVFAASSPQGKIYRHRKGETEVYFEPNEDYVWQLARDGDGNLLAATGTRGRLYRITGQGEGEVLVDADDTHLRSLEVLADGSLVLGTAGEGLVLRYDRSGRARTLYDGDRPEVVDFAVDPDGGIYVALLASEASMVDLSQSSQSQSGEGNGEGGEASGETQVAVATEGGLGSRPARFQGARSEIIRIARSGAVEKIWSFDDETVYALAWARGRLWIGTGLDGKLYSRHEDSVVLEEDVDERQIVGLLVGDDGPVFATTNASALYRIEDRPRRSGSFTSAVLDAGEVARFGTLRWVGEAGGTPPRFAARSGLSSEPDRTWSDWTPAVSGREVDLTGLPRGRFVQWRVELEANGKGPPRVDAVYLSYRQDNVAPEIESLQVLESGQILVPTSFNPAQQVFEPVSSTREGIFKSLTPSEGRDDGRTKTLWKIGYRTLSWEAKDANGDELRSRLQFRQDGDDAPWLDMLEDHDDSWYSFDATVLPDGVYRFRLEVTDQRSNLPGEELTADRVTELVVVDHSAPEVVKVEREAAGYRVWVKDALSPLREARVSVDAGAWQPVSVADELLDEQEEELVVEVPRQARLVLLRLTDAAHNVVTENLSERTR